MPSLTEIEGRFRYSIERFDGGLNTKDAPSKISPYETPDCLNVVFDEAGDITTRPGFKIFNTVAIGFYPVDGGISYASNMGVGLTGICTWLLILRLFRLLLAFGQFSAGKEIAAVVYQNV